jgi:hypothetical protein
VRIKHYRLRGAKAESASLLFHVRLNIQDVRSGYRVEDDEYFEGPWFAESDLHWTRDMVKKLDGKRLIEVKPSHPVSWPQSADEQIIHYLLHFYRPMIWKNFELNLYSNPYESKEEFVKRCINASREQRQKELERVIDVYLRRFLEVEKKLLAATEEDGWERKTLEDRISQIRQLFSQIRERFSFYAIREESTPVSEADFSWTTAVDIETQERLAALREEFLIQYNRINHTYEEGAKRLESYEVPLSHLQIEILGRGCLWR